VPKLINDLSHLANRCMPRLHTCKHTRTCIHALLAHPRGKKYWSAKGHSTILPQTLPQNSRWLNTPSPNYLHRPCPRLPTLGKNLGVQRPMLHQGDLPQGRHSTILPQTFPQNSRWLNTPSPNYFHRPCPRLPTLDRNRGVQRAMFHQGDILQGRLSTILPQTFPQNSRWLNTPSLNHFHRPCPRLPTLGKNLGVQRPMLHQGDILQGRLSTILLQTFPQNSRWLNTPSLNHFHRPVRSYCSVLPHAGQDSPLEGACDFLAYETGGECTTSCCTCARILKFHR